MPRGMPPVLEGSGWAILAREERDEGMRLRSRTRTCGSMDIGDDKACPGAGAAGLSGRQFKLRGLYK